MSTNITGSIFHDEAKALAHLEASRWGGEPTCRHCGSLAVRKMGGKTQAGMFLCNDCRDKFTVRTGSVMERSHVPLHKWLLAFHLMAANKRGMSAKQMERMLGVTYKTAWFFAIAFARQWTAPLATLSLAARIRSLKPMKPMWAARPRTAPPAACAEEGRCRSCRA